MVMNVSTQLQVVSIILALSSGSVYTPTKAITTDTLMSVDNTLSVVKKRDLTDVSIGGVKIGMTLQQVINKLGKPSKTTRMLDPCSGQDKITLKYYKLVITILGNSVLEINNSNPLYQTGEKIQIGDSLSKAKKTYDKVLVTPSTYTEENRDLLYDNSSAGILSFKSKNGKIISISIRRDDC